MGKRKNPEAANPMVTEHSALSLEQYLQIRDALQLDPDTDPIPRGVRLLLTCHNFAEVLKIHGIARGQRRKKELLDDVRSVEMSNPCQDSLDLDDDEDEVSYYMTIDEMEADLAALGWLDCPALLFPPPPPDEIASPNLCISQQSP